MPDLLSELSAAVAAVADLPVPVGLGASDALAGQVDRIAEAIAALQRQLAHRMAALTAADPRSDPRGLARAAGLPAAQAGQLHAVGRFVAAHPDLAAAWREGRASLEQVSAVRAGSRGLSPRLHGDLVAAVLDHLPTLDARATRRLVAHAVDVLEPGDPDQAELAEHAARRLDWSRTPRGGIAISGYLPQTAAAAFTTAINALVDELRVAGDGLTGSQRRADALAALIARAALPNAGGLPPAVTLTIDLRQAERVAARDPGRFGSEWQPRPADTFGDAAARHALCCGTITPVLHSGSLLARIAGAPLQPLAVGRRQRLATAAQRRALALRDGGCAIPGCDTPPHHGQPHHVTGWALDGPTDLDNLVNLCHVHHTATELGRYRFIPATAPPPPGAIRHANWWIIPPRPAVGSSP